MQPVIGKFVEAAVVKGGKHLKFNNKSVLYNERGITDMWCYNSPKTGNPMLYLEDEKGNLIREFDLKNQIDQVRYYFTKANEPRLDILKTKQRIAELKRNEIRELESHMRKSFDYDDKLTYYTIGNYTTCDYGYALNKAAELYPHLKAARSEYHSLLIKQMGYKDSYLHNYIG